MSSEEHQVNLFARYEQRILSGETSSTQVIPAVVITGFLGSGKTTLVHHILRNRGDLRIAVLVNEVGQVDVDSQLVNARQSNAALGLPAVDLSGGCICCSRAGDLAEALGRLRAAAATASGAGLGGRTSAAPCDYLLVETSGAADAGPLAEALVAAGFRLDAVVAVVDAEAGRAALEHPVAHAQIACADVVVLNKCDLVAPEQGLGKGRGGGGGSGLGVLADLEDLLADMAPGVRVVRARYGEVPLTAVLDVVPVGSGDSANGGGGGGSFNAGGGGGGGGGESKGFMSHESHVAASRGAGPGAYRLTSGPRTADGMAVGHSRHAKRRTMASFPATTATATTTVPSVPVNSHRHQRNDPHHHHVHGLHGLHKHYPHLHGSADPFFTLSAPGNGSGAVDGADEAVAAAGPAAGPAAAASHVHAHAQSHGRGHAHDPSPGSGRGDYHALLHAGFHTESVTVAEGPCSLVAFSAFVVGRLVKEPALLRSKGVLWFGERRSHRFTFHLSGRRRVDLAQEGPWEGPPASQLVLIGTDPAALIQLKEAFLGQVLLTALSVRVLPLLPPSLRVRAHGGGGGGAGANDTEGPDRGGGCGGGDVEGESRSWVSELEATTLCVAGEERLELLGCERWERAAGLEVGLGDGGGGDGLLLNFTTRGSVLHGINAEQLNAELVRRVNASGRLFLATVTAPGRISAVNNVQSRDRILSLLLPCKIDEAKEQAALCVTAFAEPLLRKAYAHVHNCKCDVASSMQTTR